MVEQHGEKSARLKVFENTFCACLQKAAVTSNWKSGGKRSWGSIVRTTVTAKNSGGDWSVVKAHVQVDDQSTPPSIHHSFLASGLAPLLCGKMKGGRESSWKRRVATQLADHRRTRVRTERPILRFKT